MIVYFADRKMKILGHATTNLPEGFVITEDLKAEEIDTGVASFECKIGFDKKNRIKLEEMTNAGNYLLRSNDGKNEFYTIIDAEIDTRDQTIYIYAEDAGLDLVNEVVGAYEATEAHTAEWYINLFTADSGFEIGINEISSSSTRKLSWDGEATATERVASIATQFGGFEVSYSFDIQGMEITHKYINIYEKRGKDVGEQLRLNRDIDRIITKKSVANLATAFLCEGGTLEESETPITLNGYKYDDGDFYVDGKYLKSRKAVEKWSRYQWEKKATTSDGHIVKQYSYDTTSQSTLCAHAVTELKKVCDMEMNYEIDINKLPENISVGDRINIVDDAGDLYLSTRILLLETSVVDQKQTATLGEHLIKTSGISNKVEELAEKFAKNSVTAKRALEIANTAKTNAEVAKTQAEEAKAEAEEATTKAEEAKAAADSVVESVEQAQETAIAAKATVEEVKTSVSGLETSIKNAEDAATFAQNAANTAEAKAEEAATSAQNAAVQVEEAKVASERAQTTAEMAIANANAVYDIANEAKTVATQAQEIATGARADAEQALKDIDEFAENLETVEQTMQADYARKTDLTEVSANLQTQITQNANEITATVSKVTTIDETANNALEQAEQAQTLAYEAQEQADIAREHANQAQAEADLANDAANNAQAEADTAREAANIAQEVVQEAQTKLTEAQEELATISAREDATEEQIAQAQALVDEAQAEVETAQAELTIAQETAIEAQTLADEALVTATEAQALANEALTNANTAKELADSYTSEAFSTAVVASTWATYTAAQALTTANKAIADAEVAQTKANEAVQALIDAQTTLDNADAVNTQAKSDLLSAQQALEEVMAKVDATEEEVAQAQEVVNLAQEQADLAQEQADLARERADIAQVEADTAREAAINAQTEADKAQILAIEAREQAEMAKADVEALALRVSNAETSIVQNSDQIKLSATKEEVATTLGNYYTKEETEAAISVESDNITLSVSSTYATKSFVGEYIRTTSDEIVCYYENETRETINETDEEGNEITSEIIIKQPVYYCEILSVTEEGETVTAYKVNVSDGIYTKTDEIIDISMITGDALETTPTVPYFSGDTWLTADGYTKYCIGDSADVFSDSDWTDSTEKLSANAQAKANDAENKANEALTKIEEATSVINMLVDKLSMLVIGKVYYVVEYNSETDTYSKTENIISSIEGIELEGIYTDTNDQVYAYTLSDGTEKYFCIVDGGTLWEQTANGWAFNFGDVTSGLDDATSDITQLNSTTSDISNAIGGLDGIKTISNITSYIHINEDDELNPFIELGKSSSPFKIRINNEKISFLNNSAEVAYIGNEIDEQPTLVINTAKIDDVFSIGGLEWSERPNGNVGLLWKGVD